MKRKVLVLILFKYLCIQGGLLMAQQQQEDRKSNTEIFSESAGSLIEKQFITIGTAGKVEVSVMKVKDLLTDVSYKALRLEYGVGLRIAVLDSDELEALLYTIKKMNDEIFSTRRPVYTEVFFRSRSGFVLGAYCQPSSAYWAPFIKMDWGNSGSIFLRPRKYKQLVTLIERAAEIVLSE